jgi:predicted dehydrogenase
VAVAARHRARAESYAAEPRGSSGCTTYLDVINDPEVEAIYNPLPTACTPDRIAAKKTNRPPGDKLYVRVLP